MRKVIFIFLILLVSILSGEEQIGLALSGGGARALAHIGVLKVLEEENIDIKYISGTSTGALIGALYSIGYSATEIEEILLKIDWREIISDKISRSKAPISQKRWKPVANAFFPLNERFQPELPKAIFAGNNIVNELFRLTYSISHKKNYYEFPIGFSCIATDFMSGDKVVFTEGFLHQSIRASMSFPTIFEPFEIDGKIYVDGGLNDNLPVEQVKSMGADYIIASCSTSGLKARDDVNSVLDVLDQTVNFQINSNVKESAIKADLLIEPDLEDIDKLEFDKIREIIAAGERAARIYLERIRQLPKSKEEKDIDYLPSKIKFHHIKVKGNKYLSSSKIKEYLHLKKGELYSLEDISNAFEMVYNSDLFEYIYPAIEQSEVGNYQLIIFVKEKNRKRIGVSFSYNEENEFNAGLTMELNNYLQRNSKILINFKFGSDTQANIDYAKNFGRLFGIYFRLFPNYQEKVIYSYNEEHEKMSSVKSSELGINGGIGVFVNNIFDFEVYGFTNRTRIYRNIAEFETQHYQMTGIGAKIYAETLDDYVFPMSGAELIAKLTGAREDYYSYEGFTKFYSRFRLLFPFLDGISIKYGFEYGSFLDKKDIEIDPFYIGGRDSFLGLKKQEMSAPVFKIHLLSLRMKVFRNIFFDIQYNRMNLGNSDIWLPEKNIYQAIGLKVGFRNFIGPVRAAFAVDQDRKSNFYLSIGYEFDAFEFSRR